MSLECFSVNILTMALWITSTLWRKSWRLTLTAWFLSPICCRQKWAPTISQSHIDHKQLHPLLFTNNNLKIISSSSLSAYRKWDRHNFVYISSKLSFSRCFNQISNSLRLFHRVLLRIAVLRHTFLVSILYWVTPTWIFEKMLDPLSSECTFACSYRLPQSSWVFYWFWSSAVFRMGFWFWQILCYRERHRFCFGVRKDFESFCFRGCKAWIDWVLVLWWPSLIK